MANSPSHQSPPSQPTDSRGQQVWWDSEMTSWTVSLGLHLVGLLTLGWWMFEHGPNSSAVALVTTPAELITEPLQPPPEFSSAEIPVEAVGASAAGGTQVALTAAPQPALLTAAPAAHTLGEFGDAAPAEAAIVATALQPSPDLTVRGTAAGVGAEGTAGAIDRITHEILLSLEQGPTLVVWLFDQSGSLRRQRASISARLDKVYRELGVIESAGHQGFARQDEPPLLGAVMAFGTNVHLLTPEPTASVQEIQSAVAAIENDAFGVENVFQAIQTAATRFSKYRRARLPRSVMLVAFTDEAGNDVDKLDSTIQQCQKLQIPVYVIGVPAPFGRRQVNVKYIDPDPRYDQSPRKAPVDQGPETLLPERVRIHFSGTDREDWAVDSGFGPYALTRLCIETGGIYFAVHPNRRTDRRVRWNEVQPLAAHFSHFFDPVVMRRYRPAYISQQQYQRKLKQNRARAALVRAASLSWAAGITSPETRFPVQNEAALARLLTVAQQEAAALEPQLLRIYGELKSGEADRDRLTEPRWRAGFDLAMGRTLAVLTRTRGYNAMLARAKRGMRFTQAKSDTWRLLPAERLEETNSELRKQEERAQEYLQRVVHDHAGTPWAMLAKWELAEPTGWRWQETFTGVRAPRTPQPGNNNGRGPRDDQMRMLAKPKPRPLPKL